MNIKLVTFAVYKYPCTLIKKVEIFLMNKTHRTLTRDRVIILPIIIPPNRQNGGGK